LKAEDKEEWARDVYHFYIHKVKYLKRFVTGAVKSAENILVNEEVGEVSLLISIITHER
jgi:hypothetical protein